MAKWSIDSLNVLRLTRNCFYESPKKWKKLYFVIRHRRGGGGEGGFEKCQTFFFEGFPNLLLLSAPTRCSGYFHLDGQWSSEGGLSQDSCKVCQGLTGRGYFALVSANHHRICIPIKNHCMRIWSKYEYGLRM